MIKKITKQGNSAMISIAPLLLEIMDLEAGDYVHIWYNPETKKIEISHL